MTTKKKTSCVKYFATLLLGFVLFQGELGKEAKFILRINDKTGQTWILTGDGPRIVWQEVEEREGQVERGRLPVPVWPDPRRPQP